jgi:hypothetical protein
MVLFRKILKYPLRAENFGLDINRRHRACPVVQVHNIEKSSLYTPACRARARKLLHKKFLKKGGHLGK